MSHLRKTDIRDGEGNPLSSYYHGATGEYVLNVHNADVHGIPINQPFHQHTGTATTLTVAVNPDGSDSTITVASAVGFAVGDKIQIGGDDNHTGIKYEILLIVGTVFTLDSRIDFGWPIGAEVEKVLTNMNLVGTLATPQEFIVKPNATQVVHITRIIIEMTDATNGDLGDFGGIAGLLTNGVLIRANVNGQYGTFANWKSNGEIKGDMYDFDFDFRAGGGGVYGFTGRGSFSRIGVAVRLDGAVGDFMEIYVQDDLSPLLTFTIKAQGHVEGA